MKNNLHETVMNQWGDEIYMNVAVQHMDNNLFSEAWWNAVEDGKVTQQEFFDEYCRLHEEAHGEEFFLNEKNPTY